MSQVPGLSGDPAAAAILSELYHPLGLADEDLPSYETVPAGACQSCHRGPLYRDGILCIYCWKLHQLQQPPKRNVAPVIIIPGPRTARQGHRPLAGRDGFRLLPGDRLAIQIIIIAAATLLALYLVTHTGHA